MHSRKSADQIAAQQFRLSLRTVAPLLEQLPVSGPLNLENFKKLFKTLNLKARNLSDLDLVCSKAFTRKSSGRAVGFANACEHNEL